MTAAPAHKRDIGVVFQNYALFPHLSVFENVAFPLRMRRLEEAAIRTAVDEALTLVQLTHLSARQPRELSGGQQQRVAFARAIVFKPSLVLMDEPLARSTRSSGTSSSSRSGGCTGSCAPRSSMSPTIRGGDAVVRSHLPDEQREDRADRRTGQALREAGDPVRGQLHRRKQYRRGFRRRRRRRRWRFLS